MIALMRLYLTLQILFIQWFFVCSTQAQGDFTASNTIGCTDFDVKFTITSPTINSTDQVKWYFGFGDTLRIVGRTSIDTVFTLEGHYTVTMIVNNQSPVTKVNYINVYHTVNAFFQ
jgi:hypothetical protein